MCADESNQENRRMQIAIDGAICALRNCTDRCFDRLMNDHRVANPTPLARLRFENCRAPAVAMIGKASMGFEIAMDMLNVFRTTVGAVALGSPRRDLAETARRVATRQLFSAPMAELQMVQGHIDASELFIYRPAWTKDMEAARMTREAVMAKLYATEASQRVIDTAVRLHGGDGVRAGHPVGKLYREIRAPRIYEGASDVQKVIIARAILRKFRGD